MISYEVSGSFKRTEAFLNAMKRLNILKLMDSQGQAGVDALRFATPMDSGLAASSWYYITSVIGGLYTISWCNHDLEYGFPVAVMLQYGHGTGTGGYVAGRDYINPAIRPIFDRIADTVWKAVTSA
jgi:hypothetical protein